MKSQCVALVVSGSLAALLFTGCRKAATEAPPPRAVRVAVAVQSDEARDLRLSGTLEAERTTSLSFGGTGTVEAVLVQEADAVRKGQPLARLATRSFEDAVGIARSTLAQAEDARRRIEPMHKNRTIPEIKWVEVETNVEKARHSLSLAEKNLEDSVLRAPEAGIVARRLVEPGATAVPGAPVLTLVQTRTLLATAPVPEAQVATVKPGQKARVWIGALGRESEGVVREVGVLANPLTRTYAVKVALTNDDGALRIGMVAEVRLRQEGAASAVVVPPAAVRLDETGHTSVWVVQGDGHLRRQRVEVSGFVGEGTAIASGLANGERVVTSGSPMLAEGVAVSVVDDEATAVARR